VSGRLHVVRGIVREQGSSFSVSEGSCHPWAIAVRGWVGSLSMSAGSVSGALVPTTSYHITVASA
jgi:hypothetical protein